MASSTISKTHWTSLGLSRPRGMLSRGHLKQQSISFLDLPPEIRLLIYNFAADSATPIKVMEDAALYHPLLILNKQIRDETFAIICQSRSIVWTASELYAVTKFLSIYDACCPESRARLHFIIRVEPICCRPIREPSWSACRRALESRFCTERVRYTVRAPDASAPCRGKSPDSLCEAATLAARTLFAGYIVILVIRYNMV